MGKRYLVENFSIGIFDSGFGGLEIAREIIRKLPGYDYIYLGDNARAPYGNRSEKEIYNFTKQGVEFLFQQGAWLVILACNTASSESLRKIQRKYLPERYPQRRVLGVLIPAAELAVEKTKNGRIGIIATERTVDSSAFKRELKKLNPKVKIFQKACPLLVPIIEAGAMNSERTEIILKKCLIPLVKKNIDTLILGCTHYGLLEGRIKGVIGREIEVISEGGIVAEKLKSYLSRHQEIKRRIGKKSKRKFLTSGSVKRFKLLGSRFFGRKIKPEKVKLG